MITPQIDTNLDNINQEDVAALPNRTYKVTQTTSVSSESEYRYTEFEGKQIEAQTVNHNMQEFALIGDTFQQQYEGKNLWGGFSNSYTTTAQGITFTVNTDGTVTASGTATGTAVSGTIANLYNTGIYKKLLAGTYTVSKAGTNYQLQVYSSDTTSLAIVTTSQTNTTFTLTEETDVILRIRVNADTTINETVAFQLEEGSTATDYEPYVGGTASPNPDYPQAIQVVTGEQTVVIRGKNLFNENSEWNINSSVGMGGTSQGEFPYSSGGNRYTYFFKSKPNTTYTVSSKTKCDRLGIFEHYTEINPLEYSGNNKLTLDNMIIGLNKDIPNSYTFTTNENTKMVAIYYSLNTLPEDFQILETDLIRELPLSLGNMELCKTEEDKDILFKNTTDSEFYNAELDADSWYKKNEINKKTYNGTEYWSTMQSYQGFNRIPIMVSGIKNVGNLRKLDILCTHFHASDINGYNIIFHYGGQIYIYLPKEITTRDDFLDLLAEITPTLYYPLATPTYTKITDTTLINQLEAIENTNMNEGTTIIYADNEEGLQPTLKIKLPTERIIHSETTTEDRIIGKTDGLDAVKQAILHILMTERYANIIYDENYGVELEQYIGADLDYIQATIENTLKDALTYDLRIRDVVVDNIEKIDNDKVAVNFTATTIYGDLEMEVNVNV